MDATYTVPPEVGRLQQRALVVGIIALVVSGAAAFISGPGQFFRSYLVGYVFCVGVAIGSLAILMLQHLSGGAWGLVIRRLLEAATRTLPLLAVLFIPLALGIYSLYEWSHADVVARDPVLQHKRTYLNIPFFLGRTVFYFAVWGVLAYLLNKWSLEEDRTGDPRVKQKMQELSGPGLVLFGLTVSFAAIDWVMSLEPHWFSTIFGLLVMAGWGLSAFAFVIAVAVLLSRKAPMSGVYVPAHFHDLGKLMLAFVMVYAYFAFSQFLIIWSGNLPEEIPWYLRRLRGGWQYVGLALVLFHFALPFVLLLSRDLKRSARMLSRVAVLVIVMRVVDLIWLVAPAAHQGHGEEPHLYWLDFITMFGVTVGLGGLWLAFFAWQLKKRPLLPLRAPDLGKALNHAAHH